MKQTKQKLFMVAIILLFGVSSMANDEILLGKYDFSTNSTVPVAQAEGVTFGSTFGVWNTTANNFELSLTEDGYLLIRNQGTGVSHERYGYVSITPEDGKTVLINRVVVNHYKEEGSNTSRTRSYLYDMGGATPISFPTVVADLIYQGTGGFTIPSKLTQNSFTPNKAVEITTVHFMSFTGTQTTGNPDNLSQYKIRSLEFYGQVLSPGQIIATSKVDFGAVLPGNVVDNVVLLKVLGGTSVPVNIELIDPDFAFTCMQTEVDPIDATFGTWVRVSYNPFNYGRHTAQLKFSYDDKVTYTQLTGTSPYLNETFTYYVSDPLTHKDMDSTQVNLYAQEEYLNMPGWIFSDSVFWHLSGGFGLGLELRGAEGQLAKVSTPELDLSAPFGVIFRSKKMSNLDNVHGEMHMLVDSDTIWSFVNPNATLNLRTVDGFVATANSRISFIGAANDSSKVVVDEISIFPTITPALNLPAYSSKSFTSADQPVTITIPVLGYNIASDLTVELSGTPAGYEVLTPTITKAAAEAGTDIQIRYTKPTEGAEVNAVVEVKDGGLTDYRYINLINTAATGLSLNTINASVYGKTGSIAVTIDTPAKMEIFSLDGRLVKSIRVMGNTETSVPGGLYVIRLTNSDGCWMQKVHVR